MRITNYTKKEKAGKQAKLKGRIPINPPQSKNNNLSGSVRVKPMLATLIDKPFDDPGWIYEVKWDGYRALAIVKNNKVDLLSRNAISFNEKFYPIYQALQKCKNNVILDGEIVVTDEKGMADFSRLQGWRSEDDGELIYYVFDILSLQEKNLITLPLTERRNKLRKILPKSGNIRFSENFKSTGTGFYKLAQKMDLEGIVAKKSDSLYHPGIRSKDWLKIKTKQRQEVIIGGYTKNEGSGRAFSSLLVGVYEKNKLQYTGKIGTGFTEKLQKELLTLFKPNIINKCPFSITPQINKPSRFRPDPPKANAIWLNPKLICEVSFREMTNDGVMRHPSFEGLREDKKPSEVIREKYTPLKNLSRMNKELADKKILITSTGKLRKSLLNPADETQVRIVNGHELNFTNLSKIYWPKEKYTKRDLINYYYQVTPFILPYIKNRPQSLNRYPDGIKGFSFYQKNVTGKVPDWIKTFPYHSKADGNKNFMVASDESSLLYMASLGCIEINPWSSTIQNPDNPDWCIIDLDPDKNSFDQVIEVARITYEILKTSGVNSYCKTSGSTGLHIYIPLGAKYSYEQSKEFARRVVKLVHKEIATYTSIERMVNKRKGKIYLDFLQNRPQATLAAPYSLRPRPGATVSMPLHWSEVKKGLKMLDFTIVNSLGRIKEQGDLFKPVLGKGINMKKASNILDHL